METRSTTVHRGLEVSRIRYPNLGRRTSGGGEVEVDPGRSPGQPEFNSEFPVFFCVEDVFFQARGELYIGETGVQHLLPPPCGTIPTWGAPQGRVRQPSFSFFPFNSFPLMGPSELFCSFWNFSRTSYVYTLATPMFPKRSPSVVKTLSVLPSVLRILLNARGL